MQEYNYEMSPEEKEEALEEIYRDDIMRAEYELELAQEQELIDTNRHIRERDAQLIES